MDASKLCPGGIPIMVTGKFADYVMPQPARLKEHKMKLVLAVLQQEVFVIYNIIDDLIGHHGQGAGHKFISRSLTQCLPPLAEQDQQADGAEHIEHVGVT